MNEASNFCNYPCNTPESAEDQAIVCGFEQRSLQPFSSRLSALSRGCRMTAVGDIGIRLRHFYTPATLLLLDRYLQ